MKKYISSKKVLLIAAVVVLMTAPGFSDEIIQKDENNESVLGIHFNIGLQIPDEPILTDYGSAIIPGAGISFNLGRLSATFDYLRYSSLSVTPVTETDANMEINHFLIGLEYDFNSHFLSPSIGAGLIYSSIKEDVGEHGTFEDSKAGFFLSGDISKRFEDFEAGLKICYSSVVIEEVNIGGFFIMIQLGYDF